MANNQKNSEVKKEVVLMQFCVQRSQPLLEFLYANIKQSRNNVKTLLSKRHVLVDGVVVTQFDYLLRPKNQVKITKDPQVKTVAPASKLPIIYEDEEIIVIDKPSGLLSIPSDEVLQLTAYRQVSDYVQSKHKKNRVYVVHRIDRDTSGVLMFVKNEALQKLFRDNWNDLVTFRGYYAIVEGTFKEKKGTIQTWLKKNANNVMYSSKVKGQGQLSTTHYEVVKENKNYSLLNVKIDSGRKNQIRVHLSENGHPIIGDDKYGNPTNPINRLGLHAYKLTITHPLSKKVLTFNAPLPSVFNRFFSGGK